MYYSQCCFKINKYLFASLSSQPQVSIRIPFCNLALLVWLLFVVRHLSLCSLSLFCSMCYLAFPFFGHDVVYLLSLPRLLCLSFVTFPVMVSFIICRHSSHCVVVLCLNFGIVLSVFCLYSGLVLSLSVFRPRNCMDFIAIPTLVLYLLCCYSFNGVVYPLSLFRL